MKGKMKCPKCGTEIDREYYNEEVGLVEEHASCECGWAVSWAYGQNLLNPDDEQEE